MESIPRLAQSSKSSRKRPTYARGFRHAGNHSDPARVDKHLYIQIIPIPCSHDPAVFLTTTPLQSIIMPHPLAILSEVETNIAREVVLAAHPNTVIDFREIYLWEPPKDQLQEFLALEHAGRLSPTTPRPPRQALCQYDVIGGDRIPSYEESVVDVGSRRRTHHEVVAKQHHAALTL